MSNRNGAEAANSSPPGSRPAERVQTPADEALNDDIHALLREAADQREARTLAQVAQDRSAARQQFESILELSRERHATRR
jgi:hypothetical protein